MWQNYFTVTSLDEALHHLAERGAAARIVAGGTDMLIELERHQRPGVDTLIDITRVPGLDQIEQVGDSLRLGPLVSHNHVVGSPLAQRYALPLAQACWEVGAPQIRNRGTVAGNVITASPANDTITALLALDAQVTLRSLAGERQLALRDFYQGYRQTAMQADEMLTAISFPALSGEQAGIFLKLGLRRAQAIAVLNVAVVLDFEAGRQSPVRRAALALGCVAPTVIRLSELEARLEGQALSDSLIEEIAQQAAQTPSPIDDIRSPAVYRREMIATYMRRALQHLHTATEAAAFPQKPAMLWGPQQGIVQEALPQEVLHERDAADTITSTVNGTPYTVTGGSYKSLLRLLREDLKLTGTKEGCAEGECGACTVFLDGVAVMACMVPAPRAHGAEVLTVEGLASNDTLHPIQRGFVEAGAVQCGFCTPGFLMAGAKLLEEQPHPNRSQVEQSISGNLCRCTGYYKILEAFERAQEQEH